MRAAKTEMFEQLNGTLRRCRALFLEHKDVWATRERSDWISALLNPLYSTTPPSDEERNALASLAFGGWCWREVEGGDRSSLVAPLRDAFDEADGTIAPALAAWRFLDGGGRPGAGSPGLSQRRRREFLDAAVKKFVATYTCPTVTVETATAAFLRGVVLNDVERLVLGRTASSDATQQSASG